jgi:predicted metalloprotease
VVLLIALLGVCAALGAAGCGSSGSGSAPSTSPTSTVGAQVQGDTIQKLPKAPEPSGAAPTQGSSSAADQEAYLRAVFQDAQALWRREFSAASQQYAPARLTLFSRAVHSGCGEQADVGPFYCPANHGIYLDLGFFRLLTQRFGIGGFAQAYIVGHEFGHHIQNLSGISQRVHAANQQDPAGENARSVRIELQADCLAGVWAHSVYTRGELSDHDIQQALKTAAVIGDDFGQRSAGHVVDSAMWTHGSSQQRQTWLKRGFEEGDPGACDTFSQPV